MDHPAAAGEAGGGRWRRVRLAGGPQDRSDRCRIAVCAFHRRGGAGRPGAGPRAGAAAPFRERPARRRGPGCARFESLRSCRPGVGLPQRPGRGGAAECRDRDGFASPGHAAHRAGGSGSGRLGLARSMGVGRRSSGCAARVRRSGAGPPRQSRPPAGLGAAAADRFPDDGSRHHTDRPAPFARDAGRRGVPGTAAARRAGGRPARGTAAWPRRPGEPARGDERSHRAAAGHRRAHPAHSGRHLAAASAGAGEPVHPDRTNA